MPHTKSSGKSPLVEAAEAFDGRLRRLAALAESVGKTSLDSSHGLARAAEGATKEVVTCEEDLQAQARLLVAALGQAREAQEAQ